MTGTILFGAFIVMLLGGVPIGVALGLAGALAIWLADQSILAMPTNVYAGIAKYPLIAIPMFVLVGSVFDRTGVALRLVRFATALVGAGRGALASVAVLVAMGIMRCPRRRRRRARACGSHRGGLRQPRGAVGR